LWATERTERERRTREMDFMVVVNEEVQNKTYLNVVLFK